MQTIRTIGLDIAKSVFQVHGVDAGGQVIVRRHRHVWSVSKPARRLTTGLASSKRWVTRCG